MIEFLTTTSVRIIEDASLVETIEDWSRVRSPARARRRRKRGFRQNIALRQVPRKTVYSVDGGRTLYVHPVIADAIRRELSAQMRKLEERAFGML